MNPGNFWIFELSQENFNLDSSVCRASKSMSNDTKHEPVYWKLHVENSLLKFCVGVQIGGHPTNFTKWENFISFDTNIVHGSGGANMVLNEKATKNGNYVGWNCVGLGKSNK